MDFDSIYLNIAVVTAFLLIYSLISGRFESRFINGPLIFMLVGFIMGSSVLGWLDLTVNGEGLRLLAEMTLVIVLFSDAANTNWAVLLQHNRLPIRLLLIGLPLTLVSGAILGHWLFPQVPLLELAILSTILAPTDAALGKAVVTNPSVPAEVRESLNQESGLNDGICVPVLLILLSLLAPVEQHHGTGVMAILLMVEEIGIGVAVAYVMSRLTIAMLKLTYLRGWQIPQWRQLTLPGLALLCFATAQSIGGSGFIAAFVGGLFIGHRLGEHKHDYIESSEGYGSLLSVIIWMVFGAAVIPAFIGRITWEIFAYAMASLTILRMLPVWISLTGLGIKPELRLFIGWFGPRGLASIVFVVMVMQHVPALTEKSVIVTTVFCTILLSVILHGITANPWAKRLGRIPKILD